MTGDGVNDAPALKKADIGIAVDDATDAARGASDIVLTEPGLSVIISAVLTSRAIFQRMKNYTVHKCFCLIGYYLIKFKLNAYIEFFWFTFILQIYAVSITIRIVVSFSVEIASDFHKYLVLFSIPLCYRWVSCFYVSSGSLTSLHSWFL